MNVLAMVKGEHRYVFLWDNSSYDELFEVFDRYARNPKLNFNPDDAALLSRKARESRARYHTDTTY